MSLDGCGRVEREDQSAAASSRHGLAIPLKKRVDGGAPRRGKIIHHACPSPFLFGVCGPLVGF
jgi:hypothetical protein